MLSFNSCDCVMCYNVLKFEIILSRVKQRWFNLLIPFWERKQTQTLYRLLIFVFLCLSSNVETMASYTGFYFLQIRIGNWVKHNLRSRLWNCLKGFGKKLLKRFNCFSFFYCFPWSTSYFVLVELYLETPYCVVWYFLFLLFPFSLGIGGGGEVDWWRSLKHKSN